MLLAFTAIILVGAVVPLTLNATSHDRNSFIAAAAGTARTDAVLAQAQLGLDAAQAAQAASPKPHQPPHIVAAEAEFSILTIVKEALEVELRLPVGSIAESENARSLSSPTSDMISQNLEALVGWSFNDGA